MLTDIELKNTPLVEEHQRLKAKMVPFGGWFMPLEYEGILAEYEQTRHKVSVFDTSHMGEFIITGSLEQNGLDTIVTQPLADMPSKTCRYGLILNEQGGVMDDLIVFKVFDDQWFIVVNAGTTDKDAMHFVYHLKDAHYFTNISSQTGKLDIQGPLARDLLTNFIKDIERLDYYGFDYFDVLGENVLVSRTGYTGELGYEIYYPWDKTGILWQEVIRYGAKPAGLGVRDVLRLEMGYSLYGHELNEQRTPLESGLAKFIDWHKDFIGKQALVDQKEKSIPFKIICLASTSRRSPRGHHKLYAADGREIGWVSSGSFSPSLNRGLGLGFVTHEDWKQGTKIFFGDDKHKVEGQIVKRPIYTKGSLKS